MTYVSGCYYAWPVASAQGEKKKILLIFDNYFLHCCKRACEERIENSARVDVFHPYSFS